MSRTHCYPPKSESAPSRTSRRRFILGGSALGLGLAGGATRAADRGDLGTTESLQQSLTAALARRSPLVVMVSLHGCPFCQIARENYLLPLQRETGLAMVQLNMRDTRSVVDFDGSSRTQDAQIRNWGIRVAPTLLFFGPAGVEIAPRLEGASVPDFYGYYLDERVQAAKRALTSS